MITINNPNTLKAAVDAGAVKKLSQLLKESYDPINTFSPSQMWSSEPVKPSNGSDRKESLELGPSGISSAARHPIKVRETTLVAIAAIASDKDEY